MGLVTPGALVLDVWPALVETPADAERARTFGVRDDLTFGESGDGRTFRYIAALPRVGATGRGGPSCSWTFRPFADAPLATSGYRVFAVVSAPSPVFQIDGNLAADSTLTRGRLRRDGADFAIAEATPFDVPVGLPFGELVAQGEGRHYDDGWDGRTERDAGREAWQTTRRGSTDSPRGARPRPTPEPAEPAGRARRTRGPQAGRLVSTGLAEPHRPDRSWPRARCARPDADYLYWLTVAATAAPGAIDDGAVQLDLPPDTPVGAVLTVALFTFPGEIEVPDGADVGELVLNADGSVGVHRQPSPTHDSHNRLLFPIRTPPHRGRHRLRCNIYCKRTLLQSRLVEIEVADGAPYRDGAVRSTTDYLIDTTLDPAALAAVEAVTLSVFVNDNGNGTHGFRFLGDGGAATDIKADVVLDAVQLQNLVEYARRMLRMVAWRHQEEWRPGIAFRYDGRREPDLDADLVLLARAGYRLWAEIGGRVARERAAEAGRRPLAALQALMRAPGTVEFATKYDAGQGVPAALLYDYVLDADSSALTVCRDAMDAIDRGVDLAAEPCFQGACPSQAGDEPDDTVVCPGGFWGFRHRVGLPRSMRAHTVSEPPPDPPSRGLGPIRFSGDRPHCVVGIAAEFAGPHPTRVSERGDTASRPVIDDRAGLLAALRTGPAPHLVYLFCHGMVSPNGLPALRIGPPGSDLIGVSAITDGRMGWPTRPLVVLNGCRTGAVEPQYAMSFVNAFVRNDASGVVGTEVTTHESLAAGFSDLMLDAWFTPGVPIAEAVRRARLGLLARGNPLGMIYVAYAAPQLRLGAEPAVTRR